MMMDIVELDQAFKERSLLNTPLQLLYECEESLLPLLRSEVFVTECPELIDEVQQALTATCRAIVLLKAQKDLPSQEYFACLITIRRSLVQIRYCSRGKQKIKDDGPLSEIKDQLCRLCPQEVTHHLLEKTVSVLNELAVVYTYKNNPKIQKVLALASMVTQMDYEHRILGAPLSRDYFHALIQMRGGIIELCLP